MYISRMSTVILDIQHSTVSLLENMLISIVAFKQLLTSTITPACKQVLLLNMKVQNWINYEKSGWRSK